MFSRDEVLVDQELIIAQTNSNPKSELVSEVGTHREAATFLKKRGCAVQELAFTSRKQEGREQAGGCLLSASLIDDGFFAYSDIHTRCSPPTASLAPRCLSLNLPNQVATRISVDCAR